jgi:hypothetical protein
MILIKGWKKLRLRLRIVHLVCKEKIMKEKNKNLL